MVLYDAPPQLIREQRFSGLEPAEPFLFRHCSAARTLFSCVLLPVLSLQKADTIVWGSGEETRPPPPEQTVFPTTTATVETQHVI